MPKQLTGGVPLEYLRCRIDRHSWDPWNDGNFTYAGTGKARRIVEFLRTLRCRRCGGYRDELVDGTFKRVPGVRPRYRLPKDYKVKGGAPPRHELLAAEYAQRGFRHRDPYARNETDVQAVVIDPLAG